MNIKFPFGGSFYSEVASMVATVMFFWSVISRYLPPEYRDYLLSILHRALSIFNTEMFIIVNEFDDLNRNQLFDAAEIYLSKLAISNSMTKCFRTTLARNEKKLKISVEGNIVVQDTFDGIKLKWKLVINKNSPSYVSHPYPDEFGHSIRSKPEIRHYVLCFNKKHKLKVMDEYFPYFLEKSKEFKEEKKTLKLHRVKYQHPAWESVVLDHPSRFETLAMEDEIKNMIVSDLERFLKRKDLYRKVGKAWKRGYLLYGPPGTGKSSLIAAMANYLNFDVYDLELTAVRGNSALKSLIISTPNRSILVVEDIDASIDPSITGKRGGPNSLPPPLPQFYDLHNQIPQITLSGLLNFIDGLWTSCGDERIIVFTTNHIDKIDPALLRPGRMDVHIHMSYCTPCGFKTLVTNYLGSGPHPLVSEAEELIASNKVTPAEVGEQLLRSDDPRLALQGLIEFIQSKKESEALLEAEEMSDMKNEDVKACMEENQNKFVGFVSRFPST